MRIHRFYLKGEFKNLKDFKLDFDRKDGIALLIGNNGSGKSNILEALSSVFAGLYDQKFNPNFAYELSYSLNQFGDNDYRIDISFDGKACQVVSAGQPDNLTDAVLPTQVVCSYSGEESRLWEQYYKPFYDSYTKALVRGVNTINVAAPTSRMVYINKYYWDVALLTFFLFDFNNFPSISKFCKNVLGIAQLNSVKFTFDNTTLRKWRSSPVKQLVQKLNPEELSTISFTLEELKEQVDYLGLGGSGERTFFRYIAAAFLPKGNKLIKQIHIELGNGLPATVLSEGEKKLLLIQAVLDIVSDEDSLILLDEPDSHVHISRKATFQEILAPYDGRQNIITTHSPTLTHAFKKEHIVMLTKGADNNATVVAQEKQDAIHQLTDGVWSYQEQNIFLNSRKDILLVEGVTDERLLSVALAALQLTKPAEYSDLSFDYLPCGGAEGVKLMVEKFRPRPGQIIIALFDRDQAGWNAMNKVLGREKPHLLNSKNFGLYRKKEQIWVVPYPVRRGYRGGDDFNLEDYFPKKKLNEYIYRGFKSLNQIVTKKDLKEKLRYDCVDFNSEEFRHFARLFDLIKEIKSPAATAVT